jgi:type I restriction enzyme S subunit
MTNFEQISDVTEIVPCVRRFILDLAVRGKLVAQDPNDEPAKELLKRIVVGKTGRARAGEAKKDKPLPPIAEDTLPFELPPGWAWERLGNIGETNIGLTYSPQEVGNVGTPVLRSSNIQNGKLDFSDLVRVKKQLKPSVMVRPGDLLICARNGSRALVGKVAIIEDMPEPAAFGAFMAIFRSEFNQYIYNFICSPLFRQVLSDVNTTTINQITQSNLRSTIAPVPPLAEQHRIVAKVDELMTLCDRWKASITTRLEIRSGLLGALLNEALLPPEARDEVA